jgi:hypothetical protein
VIQCDDRGRPFEPLRPPFPRTGGSSCRRPRACRPGRSSGSSSDGSSSSREEEEEEKKKKKKKEKKEKEQEQDSALHDVA